MTSTTEMTSPCESLDVWQSLLIDLSIGAAEGFKLAVAQKEGRTPADEEVEAIFRQKYAIYLRALNDAFDSKYHNRARRALKTAKSLINAASGMNKKEEQIG